MEIVINTNNDNFYRAYTAILTSGMDLSENERSLLVDMLEAKAEDANVETITKLSPMKFKRAYNELIKKGFIVNNELVQKLYVERGDITISFKLRKV